MPAQRILSQVIAHQAVQAFEPFAHVYSFDRNVYLGRRPQAKHYALSAIRISRASSVSRKLHELSTRRPFESTTLNPGDGCSPSTVTFTSSGLVAFVFFHRQ